MDMFRYESSTIDWCEPNYVYAKGIAEFWNALSNILFLILGYYGIKYCVINKLKSFYYLLFTTYFCIGIFSGYYHSTLSHFGQIMDELCIYFLIILIINKYFNFNIVYYLVITPVLLLYPQYNPLLLYFIGFGIIYILIKMYSKLNKIQKVILHYTTVLFVSGACFWIFDYVCMFRNKIHTHFVFHILISVTGFTCIIFFEDVDNNRNNYDSFYHIV